MRASYLIVLLLVVSDSFAGLEGFSDGPLIVGYGKHTAVKQDMPLDKGTHFKVAFDVSDSDGKGKVNKGFETLARFLNMHVANGIPAENIQLAMVVHGQAAIDLLTDQAYQAKYQQNNPNKQLINLLLEHKVRIYMCGQSAAYQGITNVDLMDGVQMALSAMTAHAVLQNNGYKTNPF